ncbi:MAG: AraC family transcriptional regulator [Victivallaceae bacterium]|nr:AraC family transcriptional regulator [Victivallaceae bacterium]
MTRKNTKNFEINISPIPSGFRDLLVKSGMYICTYYENVPSGINEKARQPFDKKVLRRFPFFVVTHLVGGDGTYASDESGRWIDLEPGWGILASPFHSNIYGGKHKKFIEDSIAFNGKTAHALFEAGIVRDGLIYIGAERRLLPIINKLREGTLSALLEANAMLQNLLFHLNHEQSSRQPLSADRKIERLLQEIQDTPAKWWTVAEMAEYCNISENYLRTLFRRCTGLSPKEYIDNLKMNRAVEMLNDPQIRIYEIAERLGYMDNYHFIRRFAKILGQSPGKYRRNMRRY